MPACDACHGPGVAGPTGSYGMPDLECQKFDDLSLQLTTFRSGERANDVYRVMRDVRKGLTDAEIAGLAAYYSEPRGRPRPRRRPSPPGTSRPRARGPRTDANASAARGAARATIRPVFQILLKMSLGKNVSLFEVEARGSRGAIAPASSSWSSSSRGLRARSR